MTTTNTHKAITLALLTAFGGTAQAGELCKNQMTLISAIQGSGKTSPMVDKRVTVRAVVTAVMPGMGGYYLQEESGDWDDSDKSSEGIFVFDKDHAPNTGDLLAIKAKVNEFKELTQLKKVTDYSVCASGQSVTARKVTLPFDSKYQMESYEGMLIQMPQTLTISENYSYARFGQLKLSNGRLFQPSNIAMPGEAANKVARANRLNQIILDDGSMAKNPKVRFNAEHSFRTGNTVSGIEGVVHYSFGNYMIEPVVPARFHTVNKRDAAPVIKHKGNFRVASFNVLNYFNGNGDEKAFPTDRGASSKDEFERQNTKIVAAMQVIDADVFGLMEMENDGYGPHSAIVELTDNLSKASGKNFRFVAPQSDKLGDGKISVGMIYNADKVDLVGKAVTLNEAPFNVKSRLPLAQTFKAKTSGEAFTLVVNHFKSKGSCPKDKTNPNADQRDGQGCWNPIRTLSSTKLAKWLASNPTGSNDPDVLIIGDLNANSKEDPVTTLVKAGYTNVLEQYQGNAGYSYVYRGLAGSLDHALASKTLTSQVVDVTDWHINADEMRITDYNLENKSDKQQKSLFRANAFRSSDHDPVIIELSLK